MVKLVQLYVLTVPVFFAIDMVWLGIVAKGLYQKNLGPLMRPDVNWPVAIGFYLLYIVGIIVLAVLPAAEKNELSVAVMRGAVLGLVAYATYDLTNLSTLKDWPALVSAIDLLWGTVLTATVALVSFYIARWLGIS